MHNMQDEAIGGQLEPEMGGAAALPNPQPPPPRTYADKISMSEFNKPLQGPGLSALAYAAFVCNSCQSMQC